MATKTEVPEGMVPWEQTEEAMALGDSHPEDDIWVSDEEEADSGDSRTTEGNDGEASPAPGGEYQEGQEEPETAPGGVETGQEQQQSQTSQEEQPQEAQGELQQPQEAQGEPQDGLGEGLSVDDPEQAQQLLQNVDRMDRSHLMQVAKLIWGDDYEPEDWATDDYLREDVRGSLMDIIDGQGEISEGEEEE